jgi:enterochelin esterase-like enzyme
VEPDSLAAQIVALVAVVVAAVLLAVLWDVLGGWRRALIRVAALTLSVLMALATAGVWLNRETETYSSWSMLVGGHGDPADEPPSEGSSEPEDIDLGSRTPPPGGGWAAPGRALSPPGTGTPKPTPLASDHPAAGRRATPDPASTGRTPAPGRTLESGTVPGAPTGAPPAVSRMVSFTVPGKASGLNLAGWAYLPAVYDQPGWESARFPVIEAFHGYPGAPRIWWQKMKVQQFLDREIAAERMAPTIVVFPYQTPAVLVDTECVDLVKGPHTETFLTVDVPAYVKRTFRVRADRAGWGVIGYSAGGFCATNILLRNPQLYSAGASLSGYADAGIVIGDGSEKTYNNAAWRLKTLPVPPVSLYLACARDDAHALRDMTLLASLARNPLSVTTGLIAHGGHSHAAWRAMEPAAFDWLSSRLARPDPVPGPAVVAGYAEVKPTAVRPSPRPSRPRM